MLIYLEGVDKSGKSTLARELSSALKIPVYRKQPPTDLDLSEHHSYFKGVGFALTELHNIFNFKAIIDRSFVSDWIYSNRSNDVYPLKIWQEWENRHQNTHAVLIIIIETPLAVVEERLSAAPDPYMSHSDIARFLFLYDTYIKQTQFHVIRINGVASHQERCNEIEAIKRAATGYNIK
jgi:thymidylate kinase